MYSIEESDCKRVPQKTSSLTKYLFKKNCERSLTESHTSDRELQIISQRKRGTALLPIDCFDRRTTISPLSQPHQASSGELITQPVDTKEI